MNAPDLRVAETPERSAHACGVFMLQEIEEVLKLRPRAAIAISGGNTPKPLFAFLAQADVDWSRIHVFWVDERCVPPADNQSNFKLANETLLQPAAVPHRNIHRICGELTPEEAAIQYIGELRQFFELDAHALPVFDLLHRGMGPDAHTASLFPGDPLISNRTGIAAAVWVDKLRSHRVTLLPGVLIAAARTVLQVAGEDKAEALRNVLHGADDPLQFPCQIATRGSEKSTWFLDKSAASKL
ncbi:MAG: 6-phosphogluconolactonase [Acidobacteriaceae bacterium]|nr:6-phosphogluconolactonase [Acidobacteriaceae bacterium]